MDSLGNRLPGRCSAFATCCSDAPRNIWLGHSRMFLGAWCSSAATGLTRAMHEPSTAHSTRNESNSSRTRTINRHDLRTACIIASHCQHYTLMNISKIVAMVSAETILVQSGKLKSQTSHDPEIECASNLEPTGQPSDQQSCDIPIRRACAPLIVACAWLFWPLVNQGYAVLNPGTLLTKDTIVNFHVCWLTIGNLSFPNM